MKSIILFLLLALPWSAARAGEFALSPGTVFSYSDSPELCRVDPARSKKESFEFTASGLYMGRMLQRLVLLLYDCPYFEFLTTRGASGSLYQNRRVQVSVLIKPLDGSAVKVDGSRDLFIEHSLPALQDAGGIVDDADASLDAAIARLTEN